MPPNNQGTRQQCMQERSKELGKKVRNTCSKELGKKACKKARKYPGKGVWKKLQRN